MSFLFLGVVAFIVGLLIGSIGIGGILLIPAIAGLLGMSTSASMGTALFSFIFTGIIGTWLYHRRGSIDWGITLPICAGSLAFGYLGALVNSRSNPAMLNLALACIIIFAGVYVFKPAYAGGFCYDRECLRHRLLLMGIGGAVGFASGLTGVGGAVLSIPLMIILGFSPLVSIATAQVIQITAGLSGTAGNLVHGTIDFAAAGWVTVFEIAGVFSGVRLAHQWKTNTLRTAVAVICILVGGMIGLRALLPFVAS